MSDHPKIPLAKAETIAAQILQWLAPAVTRAEIAGSIRRRAAEVSDIEIVCVPKIEETAIDLFGQATDTRNLLDDRVAADMDHLDSGEENFQARLDKNGRAAIGSRYKRLLWQGRYPLDLFAVIYPAQFGVILAIRTGPADFSHRFVTQRSKGGLLPDHMYVKNGALWTTGGIHHYRGHEEIESDLPVEEQGGSTVTQYGRDENGGVVGHHGLDTEKDFFGAIALKYLEPWERR